MAGSFFLYPFLGLYLVNTSAISKVFNPASNVGFFVTRLPSASVQAGDCIRFDLMIL
jgi:hypothetical protein